MLSLAGAPQQPQCARSLRYAEQRLNIERGRRNTPPSYQELLQAARRSSLNALARYGTEDALETLQADAVKGLLRLC